MAVAAGDGDDVPAEPAKELTAAIECPKDKLDKLLTDIGRMAAVAGVTLTGDGWPDFPERNAKAAAKKACPNGHVLTTYTTGSSGGGSAWCREGVSAMYDGREGVVTMNPDSDNEVKLRWANEETSRYIGVSRLSQLTSRCDGCRKQISSVTQVMDCRQCNWFLCSDCCQVVHPGAPSCPSCSTKMFWTNNSSTGYRSTYNCDSGGCSGQRGDRWWCGSCRSDICGSCHAKPTGTSEVAYEGLDMHRHPMWLGPGETFSM